MMRLDSCNVFAVVGNEEFHFEENRLGGDVDGDGCAVKISPMKVEIVIPKKTEGLWREIVSSQQTAAPAASSYPSSSKTKTDWNKLDKECELEVEKDLKEAGGESALNSLFRDIYSKGSEETRRAMNKSFQSSCGTVLSTNWEEVQKKQYDKELEAPGGQVFKSWEK
eukprot:GHVQ01015031.1.p1 GENE.GHVQ01015031.1~~GHVQ01015031.1.p1  ORF type:complete len:167 (+),score=30.48 GHVQ01015031.1:756-1256(+)